MEKKIYLEKYYYFTPDVADYRNMTDNLIN